MRRSTGKASTGKQASTGEVMRRLDEALNDAGLKNGARGVLFVLVYKSNEHGEAWCTEQDIAGATMSLSTLRVYLRALEAAGLVWRIEWKPKLRALASIDPRTGEPRKLRPKNTLWLIPMKARQRALDLWRAYDAAPVFGRPPLPVERSTPAVNDAPGALAPSSATPTRAETPPDPARPDRALYAQLCEAAASVATLASPREDLAAEFCRVLSSQGVTPAEIPAFVRALSRPGAWWWRSRKPPKGADTPAHVTLQDLATGRAWNAPGHTWERWSDLLAHVRAARPSAPAALAPSSPPTSTPVTRAPTAPSSAPPPVTLAPPSPRPSAPAVSPWCTADDFAARDAPAVGAIVCDVLRTCPRFLTVVAPTVTEPFFGRTVKGLGWGELDVRKIVWHWNVYLEGARYRVGALLGDSRLVRTDTDQLTRAVLVSEHTAAGRWWEALPDHVTRDLLAGRSLSHSSRTVAENVAAAVAPLPRRPSPEELRASIALDAHASTRAVVQVPEADGAHATEAPAELAGPTRAEPAPKTSKAPTGS